MLAVCLRLRPRRRPWSLGGDPPILHCDEYVSREIHHHPLTLAYLKDIRRKGGPRPDKPLHLRLDGHNALVDPRLIAGGRRTLREGHDPGINSGAVDRAGRNRKTSQ